MQKLAFIGTFVEIARQGSLKAAAEKLCITEAAVSKQLKQLETSLNVKLLHRGRGVFKLTEVGQQYFTFCKEGLEKIAEAEQCVESFSEVPSGPLQVICNPVYYEQLIRPKLKSFLQKFPKIKLNFHLAEYLPKKLADQIDIIFGITFTLADEHNFLRKSIGNTHSVLCASPQYLAKKGKPKSLQELHRLSFIAHSQVASSDAILFDNHTEFTPTPFLYFDNTQSMVNAALDGLGYIYTKDYLISSLIKTDQLIEILPNYHSVQLPIYIYYRQQTYPNPKISAFLDFFKYT